MSGITRTQLNACSCVCRVRNARQVLDEEGGFALSAVLPLEREYAAACAAWRKAFGAPHCSERRIEAVALRYGPDGPAREAKP